MIQDHKKNGNCAQTIDVIAMSREVIHMRIEIMVFVDSCISEIVYSTVFYHGIFG
ncbi:MAG: hypothetical protein H7839_12015 [Magnetococcus sp. YQC-5]